MGAQPPCSHEKAISTVTGEVFIRESNKVAGLFIQSQTLESLALTKSESDPESGVQLEHKSSAEARACARACHYIISRRRIRFVCEKRTFIFFFSQIYFFPPTIFTFFACAS